MPNQLVADTVVMSKPAISPVTTAATRKASPPAIIWIARREQGGRGQHGPLRGVERAQRPEHRATRAVRARPAGSSWPTPPGGPGEDRRRRRARRRSRRPRGPARGPRTAPARRSPATSARAPMRRAAIPVGIVCSPQATRPVPPSRSAADDRRVAHLHAATAGRCGPGARRSTPAHSSRPAGHEAQEPHDERAGRCRSPASCRGRWSPRRRTGPGSRPRRRGGWRWTASLGLLLWDVTGRGT